MAEDAYQKVTKLLNHAQNSLQDTESKANDEQKQKEDKVITLTIMDGEKDRLNIYNKDLKADLPKVTNDQLHWRIPCKSGWKYIYYLYEGSPLLLPIATRKGRLVGIVASIW